MDLRRFYEEQLELIRKGDASELVNQHYHPEAALVTPERVVKGHSALKEMFRTYLPSLGNSLISTETFVADGKVCLIEAEIKQGAQSRRVYDVFVLEEDRIIYHFAGVFR
ncbi:MAG: nuclear transport factor 2 family protein [Bradyrhizobium sp.]|uniref:nuclear transport factor 2 family protein n=1 Tax=Bradyrhizobium sp. TaxID=376 RepID=UPI001D4C4755|nr:nuclear transport factor 2 family protein [Bradyrhizobium sp.]MBV9559665.1 nuclear transport factor 2 family protein [Bradyrhizobium sp.]